jgi:hypothetical protein
MREMGVCQMMMETMTRRMDLKMPVRVRTRPEVLPI